MEHRLYFGTDLSGRVVLSVTTIEFSGRDNNILTDGLATPDDVRGAALVADL